MLLSFQDHQRDEPLGSVLVHRIGRFAFDDLTPKLGALFPTGLSGFYDGPMSTYLNGGLRICLEVVIPCGMVSLSGVGGYDHVAALNCQVP